MTITEALALPVGARITSAQGEATITGVPRYFRARPGWFRIPARLGKHTIFLTPANVREWFAQPE